MVSFISTTSLSKTDADLLVLPFYKGGKRWKAAFALAIPDAAKPALASQDFSGAEGETVVVYSPSKKGRRILLLGLGEERSCGPEELRFAGAVVAKLCRQKHWATVAVAFPNLHFAEGILLGLYTFDALKGKKDDLGGHLDKVFFSSAGKGFFKRLERLVHIADAVNFTRDLVNGNADDIHADRLVDEAKKLAKEHALKVTVLRKKELEEESLGLLLAVNRAAPREPALIILEYRGQTKSCEWTAALVGKGVVYDTGGLSLKTSGMETMKCDMAGAGAILGTLKAVASLKLPVNVFGVLGVVENAIGPDSFKPGDVYKGHSGRTVEVTNADAEGRLVLADAISYVQDKYAFSCLIDLATLTGGAVVALGDEFSALFCNDETITQRLVSSGEATGDRVWPMPLAKGYSDMLKSKVGDLKSAAGRKAAPCTAAAFLQAFVKEGVSWAHLDIAGTAFLEEPKGYHGSNATGWGIRLLVDYLEKVP